MPPGAPLPATAKPRDTAASGHARSARLAPPAIAFHPATAQAEPAARASRTLAAELAERAAVDTEGQRYHRTSAALSMPTLEAEEDEYQVPGPASWQSKELSPECKKRAAMLLREQIIALGCGKPGDAELCAQDRQSSQGIILNAEEEELLAQVATWTSDLVPDQAPSRRPRPDSDSEEDAEPKRQRTIDDQPQQQDSEHIAAGSALGTGTFSSDMEEDQCIPAVPHRKDPGPHRASPTYADTLRVAASNHPTAAKPRDGSNGSKTSMPPQAQTQRKPKARYPPLIVDQMPNWAYHFRILKGKLGRAPNARPFGKGVKFTPQEDQEFRLIQRYLTDLERSENISWFSYSLPTERNIKVAIRGLPVDTDPEEIKQDLREQGFDPEFARPIRARKGRPGCIFLLILRRTPNQTPAIYDVNEILCMPGVTIEAWRGKRGPAQCHRCQKFRHSSHNCHRQQACVRCGGEHSAHECQRSLNESATCANCEGPHPANHAHCPVFRKEARNKRVGTTAATVRVVKKTEDPRNGAGQGTNIRTPANEPRNKGATNRKRRPRKKRKEGEQKTGQEAKQTPGTDLKGENTTGILRVAIDTLKKVLEAIMEGKNVTPIVLEGLNTLTAQE